MELIATVHVAFIVSLLFSVIKLITCQGQVQTPPTVSVTEGETATISCQFDRSAELVGLEWKRGEDANSADDLIRLFKGRKMPPSDPRFDMTSDYALTINGTTQADNGIYWCQVTLLGVFQSATNLTVLPVVTTTPVSTKAPSTKSLTETPTQRRTTAGSSIVVAEQSVDSASTVTTTPESEPSVNTVKPTKSEPKKQTSNNQTLYIIVGSVAGVISLAILVLVCYCCCRKRKTPNGYAKANPNTPV